MKRQWFSVWGWIYKPKSMFGWIITIIAVLFCVQVFYAIDRNSHSISDTFYGIFPYWVCTAIIWYWIASRKK